MQTSRHGLPGLEEQNLSNNNQNDENNEVNAK